MFNYIFRCPSNATIIKMDDDIAVDLPKIIEKSKTNLQTIGGWIHSKMNVRRRNSKWSLNKNEFEQDTFPDFVSGWAYAMKMSIAQKIVSVAEMATNLWVDDVWITGIVKKFCNSKPWHKNFVNLKFTFLSAIVK